MSVGDQQDGEKDDVLLIPDKKCDNEIVLSVLPKIRLGIRILIFVITVSLLLNNCSELFTFLLLSILLSGLQPGSLILRQLLLSSGSFLDCTFSFTD